MGNRRYVLESNQSGRIHQLSERTTVGRSSESGIVLTDNLVSDIHAVFVCTGSAILVEDLESGFGVFVNGEKIHGAVQLKDGDVIRLGGEQFTLRESDNEFDSNATDSDDFESPAEEQQQDSSDEWIGGRAYSVEPSDSAVRYSLVDNDPEIVSVYYATDRAANPMGGRRNNWYMGVRRPRGKLHYGRCEVSIPYDHRLGRLERPSMWNLEFRENLKKHFAILKLQKYSEFDFQEEVNSALSELSNHSLLLFIHGYNVSFNDAVMRTAQIAYDLQFSGLVACYSWPSKNTVRGYLTDANNVSWSIPHLEQFLKRLLDIMEGRPINVIAHSMGNRALVEVLHRLSTQHRKLINEVVLAAPDIDADTFQDLATKFVAVSNRCTMYASSEDRALMISRKIQGGYRRAGETQPSVTVVDGLDTVDASAVDTSLLGHSYYGDNRTIISDMYNLIRHGHAPDDRVGMIPKTTQGRRYWEFRP